jgi:CheY-like chemotaxis protein
MQRESSMSTEAVSERPRQILVINDTVAILEFYRAILEDEGYQVTTDGFATENAALLQRVIDFQPDLIILDLLILDERRGWQFLQLLKMERQTASIPIIVSTGAARMVEELQVHLDTMGVGVVLKPFDIDVLLREAAQKLRAYRPLWRETLTARTGCLAPGSTVKRPVSTNAGQESGLPGCCAQ